MIKLKIKKLYQEYMSNKNKKIKKINYNIANKKKYDIIKKEVDLITLKKNIDKIIKNKNIIIGDIQQIYKNKKIINLGINNFNESTYEVSKNKINEIYWSTLYLPIFNERIKYIKLLKLLSKNKIIPKYNYKIIVSRSNYQLVYFIVEKKKNKNIITLDEYLNKYKKKVNKKNLLKKIENKIDIIQKLKIYHGNINESNILVLMDKNKKIKEVYIDNWKKYKGYKNLNKDYILYEKSILKNSKKYREYNERYNIISYIYEKLNL